MVSAIGIDLGGTRIKAVVVNTAGNVVHQLYADTNDSEGAIWKTVVRETVMELSNRMNGESLVVGISAPGLPDAKNEAIAVMPGRMQGLEKFIWKGFLPFPA